MAAMEYRQSPVCPGIFSPAQKHAEIIIAAMTIIVRYDLFPKFFERK
jgi:hypothetical protein